MPAPARSSASKSVSNSASKSASRTALQWGRALLWPPSREPISWRAWSAPLAFVAAFALGCWALERFDVALFTRPAYLWLVALVPWAWRVGRAGGGGGLPRTRRAIVTLSRFVMIAAFAALLAEPRAVRPGDHLAVIYVVDVSDSVPEAAREQALAWVLQSDATRKDRAKQRVGLVVFGRDAAVETPPRDSLVYGASMGRDYGIEVNAQVARDATDLERALTLAAAMLPEDAAGRLVLISDGVATDGQTSRALDDLRSRGVPVDVLPVPYRYEQEVWVERIDLPKHVKQGDTFEANIVIGALQAGRGELVLRENDRVVSTTQVDFGPPKTRIRLKLPVRGPGYYEYTARLRPEGGDGRPENNVAIGHMYLRGKGKVLLVTDPEGEETDHKHLAAALRKAEREVDVWASHELPREALSLLPYDLILMVNVPRDQLDPPQIQALHDAVKDQGSGFAMIGGRNSFGPGGYHKTLIEAMLPVDMDIRQKKVLPKSALAIILHTCEFPEGNTWGKKITKQAIRVLGKRDDVGVLIYGNKGGGAAGGGGMGGWGDMWLFQLQPAANYAQMARMINKAEISDMPAFTPTMQLAHDGLVANNAASKHVIIISDGDPTWPPPALLKKYQAAKITVSTVTIHPHGGQDTDAMKHIAKLTGGRHYFPKNASKLPSIFIKEAKTLKKSMIQPRTFVPLISGASPILKGIEAMPPLHAYVMTTPKEDGSVNVILQAPPSKEIAEDTADPLLATWRYGLGKTAAWTSDLTANWAKDWIGWQQYRVFVQQLTTEISRVERTSHLELQATPAGGEMLVEVVDHHPDDSFLRLQARVGGPRGKSETLELQPVGPRRYRARLPLWGTGRYQVAVGAQGGGRSERAFAGFAVPYSAEYLRFRSNPAALEQIADQSRGRVLEAEDHAKVFDTFEQPRRASRPIDDLLLIALLIALVADVGLRRVQIDWLMLRRAIFGSGERTETMATLMAAKQRMGQQERDQPRPRPVPPEVRAAAPPRPAQPTPGAHPAASAGAAATQQPAQQPAQPAQPDAPTSTTGHLLAMKKRRAQQKNDGDE